MLQAHNESFRGMLAPADFEAKPLDRAAWHQPLISIVITHYNYSNHITDCLLSIVDQTYKNWECVVVDDGSAAAHGFRLREIIRDLAHPRIRSHFLEANEGQIPAFYAGLEKTRGEFVCPLDPDDRYSQDFLEEMLRAHLNPIRIVPLICCEQYLMQNDQVISGVQTGHPSKLLSDCGDVRDIAIPELTYFQASPKGWFWSSTSSMMFRRAALMAIKPHRRLAYRRAIDAYLAPGAHMLGGSMFLHERLVYRMVHDENSWLNKDIGWQGRRPKGEYIGALCRADVTEAIIANGYGDEMARAQGGKRKLHQRLKRSIAKRWRKLRGGDGSN